MIFHHVIMDNCYHCLSIPAPGKMTAKGEKATIGMFLNVMTNQFLLALEHCVTVVTLASFLDPDRSRLVQHYLRIFLIIILTEI